MFDKCRGCRYCRDFRGVNICNFIANHPLSIVNQCPCGDCLIKMKCNIPCMLMNRFYDMCEERRKERVYEDL
jgi:hypothetical protein